jgi:hypothetical protein
LVDLFGKKKLEDRISEMEEAIAVREREKEELMRTLQKREEKIKRLTSANQEANLAIKAMEQKTATMVASSPEKMETERPKARPEAWMPDNRELDLLIQRLQGFRSPREDLLVYAFPGSLPKDADIPPQIKRVAMEIKSPRGGIIIYCPQLFALQLIPPFPIKERGSWEGSSFQLSLIEEMMNTPTLVVSAHAGSTFLGVALSREGFAVDEKVESQVKEKHSKGGWSQKRFERLREEDIKNHIDAVQEKLVRLQSKYGSIVKYAVLGGEEGLIRQIAPSIGLHMVERRLKRHDEKDPDSLLREVYGFTCYRIDI